MCKCCAKQNGNKIILGVVLFVSYGKIKGIRGPTVIESREPYNGICSEMSRHIQQLLRQRN